MCSRKVVSEEEERKNVKQGGSFCAVVLGDITDLRENTLMLQRDGSVREAKRRRWRPFCSNFETSCVTVRSQICVTRLFFFTIVCEVLRLHTHLLKLSMQSQRAFYPVSKRSLEI